MTHLQQHPFCTPCAMRVVINEATRVIEIDGVPQSHCEACYQQALVQNQRVEETQGPAVGDRATVQVLPTARPTLSRKRSGPRHSA